MAATLTIAVIAVIAVAPAVISDAAASASAAAISPQKAGMAELMTSYHPRSGLIGGSWWQAAVALSALETYEQATGDTSYRYAISAAFQKHKAGDFENQYNDDTGWWGLTWLQAYYLTGNRQYLAMAETDADYMHRSWDGACGGGLYWKTSMSLKNAVTNEVFLELTAWLHNTIRGDTKYLTWAESEWSWFKSGGMINKSDLINDGLSAQCANNGEMAWTYNQGVILAGLAQLYRATRNSALLRTAEDIAAAAIRHLTAGGVLREPCATTTCGNSSGSAADSFKGIFARDLKVLAVTAKTGRFSAFFQKQARAIEARDTTRRYQFGLLWAGPIIAANPYSQRVPRTPWWPCSGDVTQASGPDAVIQEVFDGRHDLAQHGGGGSQRTGHEHPVIGAVDLDDIGRQGAGGRPVPELIGGAADQQEGARRPAQGSHGRVVGEQRGEPHGSQAAISDHRGAERSQRLADDQRRRAQPQSPRRSPPRPAPPPARAAGRPPRSPGGPR